MQLLVIDPKDNVGVALEDLKKGSKVQGVGVKEDIKIFFKVALRPIHEGEEILKYGEPIGIACAEIDEGELVHVHNIKSIRARGDLHV